MHLTDNRVREERLFFLLLFPLFFLPSLSTLLVRRFVQHSLAHASAEFAKTSGRVRVCCVRPFDVEQTTFWTLSESANANIHTDLLTFRSLACVSFSPLLFFHSRLFILSLHWRLRSSRVSCLGMASSLVLFPFPFSLPSSFPPLSLLRIYPSIRNSFTATSSTWYGLARRLLSPSSGCLAERPPTPLSVRLQSRFTEPTSGI